MHPAVSQPLNTAVRLRAAILVIGVEVPESEVPVLLVFGQAKVPIYFVLAALLFPPSPIFYDDGSGFFSSQHQSQIGPSFPSTCGNETFYFYLDERDGQ